MSLADLLNTPTHRGGSRADAPLLTMRDEHGYPLILGGQGRTPEDVRRSCRVLRDLVCLAAGALVAFGAMAIGRAL